MSTTEEVVADHIVEELEAPAEVVDGALEAVVGADVGAA
jgi:hypothetical protein